MPLFLATQMLGFVLHFPALAPDLFTAWLIVIL